MPTILFSPEITKERPAGSTSLAWVVILFLCLMGCRPEREPIKITDIEVLKEELVLHPNEGKWYYHDQPFDGFALVYHANGTLSERVGYYQGKKEGVARKWFENDVLWRESYYRANRLDGTVRSRWPNGALSSESNYIDGVRQGVQKKWYLNGQLSRQTHIKDGVEAGLQQAWRMNGKLYANYEAKNGRIFGLKRSNLCYELEDEVVQYD